MEPAEIIIPRCVISGRLMSCGPCVEQFVTILPHITKKLYTDAILYVESVSLLENVG